MYSLMVTENLSISIYRHRNHKYNLYKTKCFNLIVGNVAASRLFDAKIECHLSIFTREGHGVVVASSH